MPAYTDKDWQEANGIEVGTSNFYSPLPEGHIRILRLHGVCGVKVPASSHRDLAIQCRMQNISLVDVRWGQVEYAALSYCWGTTSTSISRFIVCNGRLVRVTVNLFEALRQLVFDGRPEAQTLWVDAVCINQQDNDEKSRQVAMMGNIYRQAQLAIVWLGNGGSGHDPAIEKWWEDATLAAAANAQALDPNVQDKVSDKKTLESAKEAFVLACAWFSRAWTFQEIVLCKTALIQYGPYVTTWSLFSGAFATVRTLRNINEVRARFSIAGTQPMTTIPTTGITLLELLVAASGRMSTIPHDRFYSLYGLFNPDTLMKPNYESHIEPLCRAITRKLMHDEGYPVFLYLKRISAFDGNLSAKRSVILTRADIVGHSWIPDYSVPLDRILGYDSNGELTIQQLVKRTQMSWRTFFTDEKPFTEKGMDVLGILCGTGVVRNRTLDDDEISASFCSFPPCVAKGSSALALREVALDIRASKDVPGNLRVPVRAYLRSTLASAEYVFRQEMLHDYGLCECASRLSRMRSTPIDDPKHAGIGELLDAHFFFQQRGQYGVRLWVVLLWNCSWPVILRPKNISRSGEILFSVVGYLTERHQLTQHFDTLYDMGLKSSAKRKTPAEAKQSVKEMGDFNRIGMRFRLQDFEPYPDCDLDAHPVLISD